MLIKCDKNLTRFQGTSLSFSSLTLTAIAIDRFILIIFPTRRSIGHQLALAMIAFNCLIAMLISLPMYFKQTLHKYLSIPKFILFLLFSRIWNIFYTLFLQIFAAKFVPKIGVTTKRLVAFMVISDRLNCP